MNRNTHPTNHPSVSPAEFEAWQGLDLMASMAWVIDLDAQILFANTAVQELLGLPRHQFLGQSLRDWLEQPAELDIGAARMSASAYRYQPRPDRNAALRERIVGLAHRHKRYGVGMIFLKLRQAGLVVNYKRVERLYQEARLQVRRRKRKKVPFGERQPLLRPAAANEVWSMDFVFDRTAEGRVIKCLTIVDDATHEAVAVEVERAVSGVGVTRVLDRLAGSRGLPKVLRTDNGKEF